MKKKEKEEGETMTIHCCCCCCTGKRETESDRQRDPHIERGREVQGQSRDKEREGLSDEGLEEERHEAERKGDAGADDPAAQHDGRPHGHGQQRPVHGRDAAADTPLVRLGLATQRRKVGSLRRGVRTALVLRLCDGGGSTRVLHAVKRKTGLGGKHPPHDMSLDDNNGKKKPFKKKKRERKKKKHLANPFLSDVSSVVICFLLEIPSLFPFFFFAFSVSSLFLRRRQ